MRPSLQHKKTEIDWSRISLYNLDVRLGAVMTRVPVSEFRQHVHLYLDKVSEGEVVQLVRRGKVVAVLHPPADRRLAARRRLDELRGSAIVGDVTSPLEEPWEADNVDP